jgi:hypothetical protein
VGRQSPMSACRRRMAGEGIHGHRRTGMPARCDSFVESNRLKTQNSPLTKFSSNGRVSARPVSVKRASTIPHADSRVGDLELTVWVRHGQAEEPGAQDVSSTGEATSDDKRSDREVA